MEPNKEKTATLHFMGRLIKICQQIDDENNEVGKGKICYVLTRLYENSDDPDIKLELRRAVYMAKMMGGKLRRIKKQRLERHTESEDTRNAK